MNYGDIKSHFNSLLNRNDITTALTTTFIDQGIARIQRSLRTPMQEKTFVVNITALTSTITLPADFLETISLYQGAYEVQRVSMERFRQLDQVNYAGNPVSYTRIGPDLHLYPQPTSGSLTLYYYAEMPALVNPTDTTPMTLVASELIIYAALTFAADYYLDERSTLFEEKFNQFMAEHQEMANDQELNGGTQAILPTYTFSDYDY